MNKIYNMIRMLADFIESLIPEEQRKYKYKQHTVTILLVFMLFFGVLSVFHVTYYHNGKTILFFMGYLLSAISVVYLDRKYV